jgi:hypothetical protein
MLLAILALWPLSLGHAQEYIFTTLAALLFVWSGNRAGADNDASLINRGVGTRLAAPPEFLFF